jgi:hypothetical protein
MKPVTPEMVSRVMSALSRRRTPAQCKGGPGRPRSTDRCLCEKFTRSYAVRRGHRCEFPEEEAVPLPANIVWVPGAFRQF